jgi:hypothetical protein
MPNDWASTELEQLEQKQAKELEAPRTEVVPDNAANQTGQVAENQGIPSEVETKTTTPEIPPKEEPVKDVEYYLKKSKELEAEVEEARATKQKRDHDLEVGLHGALQAKSKLEQERDALVAELAIQKAENAKINSGKAFELPNDILAEADEWPEVQSAIRKAVAFANRQAEEKLSKKLEEVTSKLQDATKSVETDKQTAFRNVHFAQVQIKHADAADYFNPEKLYGAIRVWAKETQRPVVTRILEAPTTFDPSDVIGVLDDFKKAIEVPGKKTLVPGDMASKVGHDGIPQPGGDSDEYISDEDMDNFDSLMSEAVRTGTLNELLKRVDNTEKRKLRS